MPKNINISSRNPQHVAPNTTEQISTDLRFIIACCQGNPSEADTTFILSHLSQSESSSSSPNSEPRTPNPLIALANQHGVLPLVYKTLKKQLKNQTIQHLEDWQAAYQQIAQRNMLMSAELIRIMKLLEENNIQALAFKGPTLAQMAYGDITLRQYGDLDILIRKKDIYKIDALLKAQGYERLLSLTDIQEKTWIKYAHDMGFIHPQKGVHLEMHWSFLDEDYPMQVELEDFWEERQDIKLNGHHIPTFSNENLIIYLCIHGSKHLWERIEWIKDIDLLIRTSNIDWDKVIEKTHETGFEKMVYLGLYLSNSLFNSPMSQKVEKEISKYPQLEQSGTFIFESLETPQNTFQKTSAMLKLFPATKEKFVYLHKIILKPTLNEYLTINLPGTFYWVYYLIRPYLLIKKYFLKFVSPQPLQKM